MKKSHIVILVALLVLILDQWLKIYVKTHFTIEEWIDIFGQSWAKIHFTENEGMAFGITLAGDYGKLFLSLFRIFAVAFLGHFIYRLIKMGESTGLLISFTLILAGAIGNVIDCVFYGVIFSASGPHGPAIMFPETGGYAPLLYGKVVDMLYFPMVDTRLPEWVPFWGGDRFQFFRFIFNIADSAITVGVISILIFHRKFFKQEAIQAAETKAATIEAQDTVTATSTATESPDLPDLVNPSSGEITKTAIGGKITEIENVANQAEEQSSENEDLQAEEDPTQNEQ
ncbi:MAG: lipoprotein signal peptidase [Bacteroidota bacterium]